MAIPTRTAKAGRWLFGPLPDLVLGCGLGYALLYAVFLAGGQRLRESLPLDVLFPLLVLLFSTPHYGATLLRVYERRADRRSYTFFAVYATALVWGAFAYGLHDVGFAAMLLTVYLTWSPWHYTGQNYGLAVMFLRRRGLPVTPAAKRLLYASFVLSYGLAFLGMHGVGGGAADPLGYTATQVSFRPIGIPAGVVGLALPVLGVAYLATLAGCAHLLLRGGRLLDLVPSALLVLTQALWFLAPLAFRTWWPASGVDALDNFQTHYYLWVAIGHAVQYLWVTSYYARASAGWTGSAPYFGKALVAGLAIWTLPAMLFAPDALGALTFGGGLGLLVGSAVNIHHFILDGAIWKLRSGPVARVLIRSAPEGAPTDDGPGRPWLRRFAWSFAALSIPLALFGQWQQSGVLAPALERGDARTAATALDRLAWLGHDDDRARLAAGKKRAHRGNLTDALRQFERAAALQPSAAVWGAIAGIHAARAQWTEALRACQAGLAFDPDQPGLLLHAGTALLKLGRPQLARSYLERADASSPGDASVSRALEAADRMLAQRAAR
jgi:hypothetical protein